MKTMEEQLYIYMWDARKYSRFNTILVAVERTAKRGRLYLLKKYGPSKILLRILQKEPCEILKVVKDY